VRIALQEWPNGRLRLSDIKPPPAPSKFGDLLSEFVLRFAMRLAFGTGHD